jgi:hypothetical protein
LTLVAVAGWLSLVADDTTVCETSTAEVDEAISVDFEESPLVEATGLASGVWEIVSDKEAVIVSEAIVCEVFSDWVLVVWTLSLETPASVEDVAMSCELVAATSALCTPLDVDAAKSELVET